MNRREPRTVTIAEIEREFMLEEASYWFGETWCPAVHRADDGGYSIRVLAGVSQSGRTATLAFDYFHLDTDGLITAAPYGYARDYKPGRVVDIASAVDRFAEPQPAVRRIA
jgi:hypothetical protein